MIFDSLGLGELGVVAIVAILFVDPKKLGQAVQAFGKMKKKWNGIQREVKQQFNEITTLDLAEGDQKVSMTALKTVLRQEGKAVLSTIPSLERSQAATKILDRLKDFSTFTNASVIALFSGAMQEIETESLIRYALSEKKTVLLPYINHHGEGAPKMEMAPIQNYDKDLLEGMFGILEPLDTLRNAPVPEPDLIVIPGLGFDEQGGRLGRGRGYYDRYLKEHKGYRLGLGFDVQILRKKLTLESHDQVLDGLMTEKKLWIFPKQNLA